MNFLIPDLQNWFRKINFQLSNVDLSVNPAMLPNGHLLSPASTENMQKGVIIGYPPLSDQKLQKFIRFHKSFLIQKLYLEHCTDNDILFMNPSNHPHLSVNRQERSS